VGQINNNNKLPKSAFELRQTYEKGKKRKKKCTKKTSSYSKKRPAVDIKQNSNPEM